MTLRSHFHYSRNALFGLWLQIATSELSNTAAPFPSAYISSSLCYKSCMHDSKMLQQQHSAPSSWFQAQASDWGCLSLPMHLHSYGSQGRSHHLLQKIQLKGLGHYVYYVLQIQNIYCKVPTEGISFHCLFPWINAHILRISLWTLLEIHWRHILSCQQ